VRYCIKNTDRLVVARDAGTLPDKLRSHNTVLVMLEIVRPRRLIRAKRCSAARVFSAAAFMESSYLCGCPATVPVYCDRVAFRSLLRIKLKGFKGAS
jgi:hypothetical protein